MAMKDNNNKTASVRCRLLNWEHKGASMSNADSNRYHSQASKVVGGKQETFVLTKLKGNKGGGATAGVESDED